MVVTFISSLFVNMCILISMIFLAGSASMERKYKPFARDAGLLNLVTTGVIAGAIGVLLMVYSVKIPPVIVDLRYVPVVLAALIGRSLTAFCAAGIVTFFRLTLYPVTESSLWACAGLFLIVLFTFLIRRTNLTMIQKGPLANLFATFEISVHLYMFVPDHTLYWKVIMPGFWIASWTALIISGMLILFLRRVGTAFANLEETASIDFLTGLNNARSFDKAINTTLTKAAEQRQPLALLMIDIDFFKRTNDTYGHPAGDAVLTQLGQVLAESCRAVDIISRNGGEEFSVILPGSDPALSAQIAERIRQNVQERPFLLPDGTCIYITVSIGVSQWQGTGHSTEQLIKQADDALYLAKHSGRNQVQFAV